MDHDSIKKKWREERQWRIQAIEDSHTRRFWDVIEDVQFVCGLRWTVTVENGTIKIEENENYLGDSAEIEDGLTLAPGFATTLGANEAMALGRALRQAAIEAPLQRDHITYGGGAAEAAN